MNMATNRRIPRGIFQQNATAAFNFTFLASEFIALMADNLQLQLKSSKMANF